MSDTPETDYYWDRWERCWPDRDDLDKEFARRLERERDKLRAENAELLERINAKLDHETRRYEEEQRGGDAISIASTRGSLCATRECRYLIIHHITKAKEEA